MSSIHPIDFIPAANSLWQGQDNSQVYVHSTKGELIHYSMRRTSYGEWTRYSALHLSYFTDWVESNQSKQLPSDSLNKLSGLVMS